MTVRKISPAKRRIGLALALLSSVLVWASGVEAAMDNSAGFEESLTYRWHLSGVRGVLARMFFPGQGEGLLRTVADGEGRLTSELRISSPARDNGEFWLYGAQIDAEGERTLRAWSRQRFRGKAKAKESNLSRDDVRDLTSSIYFLRKNLPQRPRTTQIWSSGKIYPVLVRPGATGERILAGSKVRTRSYSLRGVDRGRERTWRGRLDLVLAEDGKATPLEIVVASSGWRVKLELVESGA